MKRHNVAKLCLWTYKCTFLLCTTSNPVSSHRTHPVFFGLFVCLSNHLLVCLSLSFKACLLLCLFVCLSFVCFFFVCTYLENREKVLKWMFYLPLNIFKLNIFLKNLLCKNSLAPIKILDFKEIFDQFNDPEASLKNRQYILIMVLLWKTLLLFLKNNKVFQSLSIPHNDRKIISIKHCTANQCGQLLWKLVSVSSIS